MSLKEFFLITLLYVILYIFILLILPILIYIFYNLYQKIDNPDNKPFWQMKRKSSIAVFLVLLIILFLSSFIYLFYDMIIFNIMIGGSFISSFLGPLIDILFEIF